MKPEELKAAREALGRLTQAQLAAELGLSVAAVRHYEQGIRDIPRVVELAIEALLARRNAA